MLRPVRLAEQWRTIERELSTGWTEARLVLKVDDATDADRAAALLGPANPGRRGDELRITVGRRGGTSPGGLERLLQRLDEQRVRGTVELADIRDAATDGAAPAAATAPARHRPLVVRWEEELATLPDDWSDLLGEVELTSSDYLERAALLMSPLNPLRAGERIALTFRAARRFGYGASPGMVRRCLARCDADGITGTVHILRHLCDTDPVHTQGPVWYVGGRVV
jgi:hypothetical protein